MTESVDAGTRSKFLHALDQLHERFLVEAEGVTEVWLVRHGDAYAELVSLDDANIDPPLSPKGRREAALLGERLKASGVSQVWSSQILRARQTAALAADPGGLPIEVDPRLREVKTHWENGTEDKEPPAPGYIPFVEPLDEVIERMDGAIRDIARAAGPGGRVAAVTHAGAITMYLSFLLKLDSGPLRVLPNFTSVSVLRIKDDRIVVQSIGDVGHLAREELPAG
ncbi:MAG: histidine phosphatase family protein [Candidatus Dormiibacterota bacterium]